MKAHFTAILAALFLPAVFAGAAYCDQRYVNDRFGFTVVVPDDMTAMPEPENGDGCVFTGQDGIKVTASGMYNVMAEDALAFASTINEDGSSSAVKILSQGDNTKDVTLRRDSVTNTVWRRVMLEKDADDDGTFFTVNIECPSTDAKKHEKTVAAILKSLAPAADGAGEAGNVKPQ